MISRGFPAATATAARVRIGKFGPFVEMGDGDGVVEVELLVDQRVEQQGLVDRAARGDRAGEGGPGLSVPDARSYLDHAASAPMRAEAAAPVRSATTMKGSRASGLAGSTRPAR